MPLVASADAVIDYLVEAYREALEDDGELVALELEKSINGIATASYATDSDTVHVDCDLAKLQEVLPDSQQNIFESA